MIVELRITVAAAGIALSVCFPQTLLGYPLALELLMDYRPLGYLVTAGDAGVGTAPT